MSVKGPPTDMPIHSFRTANDFESFLEREHSKSTGIYLKLAKKSAGIPSIASAEALEIGLCFGWINGQGKPFDDQWYLARYTPRRPKSMWSKINVDTVARLTDSGRMRPAGIAAVNAAKADGRWDRAYASPTTMEVPDDFAAALAEDPAAASFFEGLNKTCRYAVLWRVHTASPQNRGKRVEKLVSDLADGKVPGRPAPAVKPETKVKSNHTKAGAAAPTARKARKQAQNPRSVAEDRAELPRRTGLRPRSS